MDISEELLKSFGVATQGGGDGQPFIYNNINVCFMQGYIHVFDIKGTFPYGKYLLPKDVAGLRHILTEFDEQIDRIEIGDEDWTGTLDVPKYVTITGAPPHGNMERGLNPGEKDEFAEVNTRDNEVVDKKIDKEEQRKINSAIQFLQKRGYVVKKLIPSYKVVYEDLSGKTQISDKYYKNKEDFNKDAKDFKFIELILSLKKEEEAMIL